MNKFKKLLAIMFRIEDNRSPWQKESDTKLKELGGERYVTSSGGLSYRWKDESKAGKYWSWVIKNNPHLKGMENL